MSTAAPPASDYDCMTCGGCCVVPWPAEGHARVDGDEAARLRRRGLALVRRPEGGEPAEMVTRLAVRPGPGGHHACVAFVGIPGLRCACSVYEERPAVCRRFEVGGALCRAARQWIGLADPVPARPSRGRAAG